MKPDNSASLVCNRALGDILYLLKTTPVDNERQITGIEAKENGLKICPNADLYKRILLLRYSSNVVLLNTKC